MKRRLLVILLAATAAASAATPASAKGDVEATLDSRIPLKASPGEKVRVAWTLASIDEHGKRQPFGARGVFVRLFSASGGKPTTGFASGDGGRTGEFEATVIVPQGGIGGIAIGLRGFSSGPTGTSVSDVYFPVKNNPLPEPAPALTQASDDAAPQPSESQPSTSASTWIVIGLIPVLALSALAVAWWRRAGISPKSSAT